MSVVAVSPIHTLRVLMIAGLFFMLAGASLANGSVIKAFEGTYSGSAEVNYADGTTANRDMSVKISQTKEGFEVAWSTTSIRANGTINEKDYLIEFVPSDRAGVFSAAMERNVFGHEVQLNPMKGEPFVWARVKDATLSVFSLFVDEAGDYELQQFDRTLIDGGLQLEFRAVRNGAVTRSVDTFLAKE